MAPRTGTKESQETQWIKFEPIIRSLYSEGDHSLPAVMKIMEEQYGFKASEKIYKYRFKKLGISKNLKASDAIAMARVKAYRGARGIPSEFWRRGKLVQPVKLQRTVARLYDEFEPLAAEDQYRTEPIETLLPPDIVVLAPHTPCGSGMVKLETLEEVCLTFQRFAISSRSGAPSSSSPRCSSGTTPGPVRATTDTRVLWWNMERDMHDGIETLRKDPVVGGSLLRTAFSLVEPIISRGEYWTLVPLLFRLSPLQHGLSWSYRAPEVTRLLVDYIAQTASIAHGPDHPFSVIFRGFGTCLYQPHQHNSHLSLMEVFWRILRDVLEAQSGTTHMDYTLAFCWQAYADADLLEPDPSKRLQRAEGAWLAQIDRATNSAGARPAPPPRMVFVYKVELMNVLIAQGRLDEALALFREILATSGAHLTGAVKWLCYRVLAHSFRASGRAADAEPELAGLREEVLQTRHVHRAHTEGTGDVEDRDMFLESAISSLAGPGGGSGEFSSSEIVPSTDLASGDE